MRHPKRLEEHGPNKLPEGKKKSALVRFLLHFHNVLIYVLMAAAVVTALLDHWIDTWVIVAVILVNAIIGYVQEGKAEKALESIKKMLSLEANVIRDGRRTEIDAEELVPGDVVTLQSGDKVPADIRLFDVRNFGLKNLHSRENRLQLIKPLIRQKKAPYRVIRNVWPFRALLL
jgi:P-type Ca2+ transporter type 2C